jgi:hypothetical protein
VSQNVGEYLANFRVVFVLRERIIFGREMVLRATGGDC